MTRSDGSYPFFFCCKADQTAAEKGDILLLMGTDNRQLSGRLLFDKFDDLSSRVLIQTGKRFIHDTASNGTASARQTATRRFIPPLKVETGR